MPKATWNGAILAQSDDTIVVDGNHYFPPEAIDRRFLEPSELRTVCGWKGQAHYCDVVVGGSRNSNAAWFYPETTDAAASIRGRIAFWRGVNVE